MWRHANITSSLRSANEDNAPFCCLEAGAVAVSAQNAPKSKQMCHIMYIDIARAGQWPTEFLKRIFERSCDSLTAYLMPTIEKDRIV